VLGKATQGLILENKSGSDMSFEELIHLTNLFNVQLQFRIA
jgi:hypothetical protein